MNKLAVLLASALLASCNSSPASGPKPTDAPTANPALQLSQKNIEAAKAALKDEPKIRDLTHDENDVVQWKIGVLDDGTDRIGYAAYICQVLADHRVRLSGTKVRIISWQRILQNRLFDDDANLGTVDCDTGNRFGSARI